MGQPLSTCWQGKLELEFATTPTTLLSAPEISNGSGVPHDSRLRDLVRGTHLVHRYATAPLKVQRPFYPEGASVCHSVMVHTAGGMVAGDRLQIALTVHPHASALVTTAAASKVYRSNGPAAEQSVTIKVASGACLEWLPQELIVFNGANYHQHLIVDLEPEAIWLGWDITRLGRTVRGERFTQGQWRSHLEVWQQGRPLWIDPQGIQADSEMMTSAHGLNGCSVIGTFALVGQKVLPELVNQVRYCWLKGKHRVEEAVVPRPCCNGLPIPFVASQIGVSRLQSGIICRYRGSSTLEAKRWFVAVWQIFRQTYLARPVSVPRVWPDCPEVSDPLP